MRQVIDTFLYNKKNAYLVVADFGHFPLMEKTDRYYNIGLSETSLVNVAIGLALAKKHVFIYSAANFVLYRAYEQLKLYINETHKKINITFLNGGAGFLYAKCGRGHWLIDDIKFVYENLQEFNILMPYSKKTTCQCLKKSFKGFNYIRLCPDDTTDIILAYNKKYKNLITFGWLIPYFQNIINKHKMHINLIPLVDIYDIKTLCKGDFLAYDNIRFNFYDAINYDSIIDIDLRLLNNINNTTKLNRDEILSYLNLDQRSIFLKLIKYL